MTQELILMFLFGVFYGTALRAAFESVGFWVLVFDCYYWCVNQIERSFKWLTGNLKRLGRTVTGNM